MPRRVLLVVDDNPGDAALLQDALSEAKLNVEFHWVENGPKAFEFLLRRGEFASKPKVHLLLLDINMPIMTGHQVHELMRAHPQLSALKVAFWSSSSAPADTERARKSGAAGYLIKPMGAAGLTAVAQAIAALIGDTQAHADGVA